MMDILIKKRHYFWLNMILAMTMVASVGYAQEAGEDEETEEVTEEQPVDPNAWKKQREEIFSEIKKEADKRARATVTKAGITEILNEKGSKFEETFHKEELRIRKRFIAIETNKWRDMENMPDEYPNMAKYLNITIPEWKVNTPIQYDKQKIQDLMRKDLEQIFTSSCPPKTYDELQADGQKAFPMYKLEEGKKKPYVSEILLRGGKGYGAKVEGRLENITVNRIVIGRRTIRRDDLDEKTQALFYDDVNEKVVEGYIQQEQRRYNAIKESFIEEWVSMTYPDMLMAEGYVPKKYLADNKLRVSVLQSNWIPRNEYIQIIYTSKLKKEIERITPEITQAFFEGAAEKFNYEYNYEFVKEAGEPEGTGEWMPTNVAEQWRMAKQAAQTQMNENPDMMPPPPM